MNVFITWSGALSREMATILREWLPLVMQEIQPFVSSEDIRKGNRWLREIQEELNGARYGIACLTRQSLSEPWLLYESGALSKDLSEGVLWTILFDGLGPADIEGPLRQFQHTTATRDDFWRLVESMNRQLERSLPEARLRQTFEQFWPNLEQRVHGAAERHKNAGKEPAPRADRQLLEELLELTRQTAKAWSESGFSPEKHVWVHREFQTVVVPAPDQDPQLLTKYQKGVAKSQEARTCGLRGYGGMGGEERMLELTFQVQHPMSREALREIAAALGLEVIDIYFRPLPLRVR